MILPLQPMGTPTGQAYQPYRSDAATDSVAMSGLRQCRTSHTLVLQAGREAQLFQGPSPQREQASATLGTLLVVALMMPWPLLVTHGNWWAFTLVTAGIV